MKISRKKIVVLCIIIPIVVFLVLQIIYIQKPHFSKYKSYVVMTHSGEEIPITDEQFQKIVQVYENDKTLNLGHYPFSRDGQQGGYTLKLYKSIDLNGDFTYMYTGTNGKGGDPYTMCLWIGNTSEYKYYPYSNPQTGDNVMTIVREAISQYENEQEV